jgi:predicted MPP superfamily phosphohydrolase
MIPAVFLGLMVPQLALCLAVLRERPGPWRALVVHGVLLGCGGVLVGLLGLFGNLLFLPMQLAAWLIFALWPTLLLGSAWMLRHGWPRLSGSWAALGVGLLLIAGWSMGVEPRWLEVTTHRITSPKLDEPLRLVLVADLQAEGWGRHERRSLERARAAQPDLVLFAGDYLQPDDFETFEALRPEVQQAFSTLCDSAPLGCVAVRGDVDPDEWTSLFATARAEVVQRSRVLARGPIVVSALDPAASRSEAPPVTPQEAFHVVLGHAPDFALAGVPADLLLAGHIHGGQVRIPGWGPVLTLSRIPRGWSSGLSLLPDGARLIVSRGLGLERGAAPRLRLFCRPELVVIELAPRQAIASHEEQP